MWFWTSRLDHFLVSNQRLLPIAFDVRSDLYLPGAVWAETEEQVCDST